MGRPLWFVEIVKKGFPGIFIIARLTKVPIIGRILDRWLFKGDHMIYLPRDRVVQVDREIGESEQMILPSRVAEYFIDKANYHWIMDVCICRDAAGCKDYPVDRGCLFLGEAALGINPKLGRRVTKEEARQHLSSCREAGLVHIVGRNKLDTVWLGVGPGNKLLTICNCCPCCCIWRVLPYIAPGIGEKIRKIPGVTVSVTDRCTGCGTCTEDVCFVDAIRLAGDRAVIGDECRGCGLCVSVCPERAIEISIDDSQFIESSINRLSPLVDVS
ncbi:MAG: 4Fe-4S binding protein [Deltaproteobacteria bacterium]|nr:MAG: 4Fe-4S binding protein [Deltaproteobacteria bacterium]